MFNRNVWKIHCGDRGPLIGKPNEEVGLRAYQRCRAYAMTAALLILAIKTLYRPSGVISPRLKVSCS